MELVIVNNGIPTTTTLAIADGTGNEHKSVIQLVRTYQSDLEQFGQVTFEMRLNTQGSPTEFANLNERQATLIMSYMKNTAIIRQFKTQLVKSFYELANTQQPLVQDPSTRALIQLLTEQDQLKQEQGQLKQRVSVIEAKQTTRDESYFTAAGFCNLKGIKLDRAGMAMIGKMASSFSRDNNLKVGKVYDSRYGEVNEYHVSALQHAVEA